MKERERRDELDYILLPREVKKDWRNKWKTESQGRGDFMTVDAKRMVEAVEVEEVVKVAERGR